MFEFRALLCNMVESEEMGPGAGCAALHGMLELARNASRDNKKASAGGVLQGAALQAEVLELAGNAAKDNK